MGLREDALGRIGQGRLWLQAALNHITPPESITGVMDATRAYADIQASIVLCDDATTSLGQIQGTPILQRAPEVLNFIYPQASDTMGIRNIGTGTLVGTITMRAVGGGAPPPWISCTPLTFTSSGSGDTSHHIVSIDYGIMGTEMETCELYISSNGGTVITTVNATPGTISGDAVLDVTPAQLILQYPTASGFFDVLNTGDQTQAINWSVAEESAYSWVSESPTSGSVTTEADRVIVTPDWNSWPVNQGQVVRSGNLIISGTVSGTPVQGSPKTFYISCSRDTGGQQIAPCVDNAGSGNSNKWPKVQAGAWSGWCGDEDYGVKCLTGPNGEMRLRTFGEAARQKGLQDRNDFGAPPPNYNSHTRTVAMEIKFDPAWLTDPIRSGQHLLSLGRSPWIGAGGVIYQNSIRFDFAPINAYRYRGFSDGFKIAMYVRAPSGATDIATAWNFYEQNVFSTNWKYWTATVSYNQSTGEVSGSIRYGTSGTTQTFSWGQRPEFAGITSKVGACIIFGNVDSDTWGSETVWMRNVVFS